MTTKEALALALVAGGLAAGLTAAPPADQAAEAPAGAVSIDVAPNQIEFRNGKAVAGRYVIGPNVFKPYFWPLNAPGGQPLTRGWPMVEAGPLDEKDHVHQKSAWFCHGDVIPE